MVVLVFPGVVRCVMGIVGNIIAIFLFLSPLPTFVKIWKKGSVEQYSPIPYLVTYLNCMVWVLYGLPMVRPHSILVLTLNAAGCFIEFTYLIIFIKFCCCSSNNNNNNNRKMGLLLIVLVVIEILFVAIIATITFTVAHSTHQRVSVVGSVGVVTAIIMYASPLSVMKLVITTKSVEYMPLGLSVASFSNALVWMIYAASPLDLYVGGPSTMGVLFGLVQFILYGMYYKSTKKPNTSNLLNKQQTTDPSGALKEEIISGMVQLQQQV